jgi:hypothetical protein
MAIGLADRALDSEALPWQVVIWIGLSNVIFQTSYLPNCKSIKSTFKECPLTQLSKKIKVFIELFSDHRAQIG